MYLRYCRAYFLSFMCPGMEAALLEEVEREREDKLCCICQDHEKCIMMLPCRHLCICDRCMEPLRQHRNTCPICRKQVIPDITLNIQALCQFTSSIEIRCLQVKQMIKAYL